MAKTKKITEQFEEGKPKKRPARYITTGSTIRDLILGGDTGCLGYKVGNIYNVVGDSGSGKCVRNAYILTENGFEYTEDIMPKYEYGFTEETHTLALSKGKQVKSTHMYREKVKHTIEIVTKRNYGIEGTMEHPVQVWTETGSVMKKLKDVNVGDYIVIVKDTNIYGEPQKTPIAFLDRLNKQANKHFVLPEYITPELALMLGYFVADGNFGANALHFSNTQEWFDIQLGKALASMGAHRSKNGNVTSVYFYELFKDIFEQPEKFTARYKYVPKLIMQSPKKVQSAFLRGLIDCDSSFNGHSIAYTTASKKLAKQVQLMLLNMGIVTTTSIKHGVRVGDKFYDHDYYIIFITRNYINVYKDNIGSDKYDLPTLTDHRETSDVEQIPFMREHISKTIDYIRKQVGWSRNGICKVKVNGHNRLPRINKDYTGKGYNALKHFIDAYKDYAEYFPDDYPYRWFVEVYNNAYYYEPVSEVIHRYNEVDVFDVHVPDGHLFWANGLVNHNTLLTVQGIVANKMIMGDKFVFNYDDSESGNEFDVEQIYGMTEPLITENTLISHTVEELYTNIRKFSMSVKGSQIGMYVVDSLDGLTSKATLDRGDARFKKAEAGKEFNEGTYAMDKQKFLSQEFFPQVTKIIENSNIVLVIISQVREKINAGMFEKKQVRSGGKALQFYCHSVEWLASIQKREMEDEDTGMKTGIPILIETTKSRTPRPYRKGVVIADFSIGIDDIASCVDFLYDLRKNKDGSVDKTYKLRPTKQNKLDWDDQLFTRAELLDYIYDNELEAELRKRVIAKWEKEQNALKNRRRPRFKI